MNISPRRPSFPLIDDLSLTLDLVGHTGSEFLPYYEIHIVSEQFRNPTCSFARSKGPSAHFPGVLWGYSDHSKNQSNSCPGQGGNDGEPQDSSRFGEKRIEVVVLEGLPGATRELFRKFGKFLSDPSYRRVPGSDENRSHEGSVGNSKDGFRNFSGIEQDCYR